MPGGLIVNRRDVARVESPPQFVVLYRPLDLPGGKSVIEGDDIEPLPVACPAIAQFKCSLEGLGAKSKLPCVVIHSSKSTVCNCKLRIQIDSEPVAANRRCQVPREALLFP